jgi:hypothetical protein
MTSSINHSVVDFLLGTDYDAISTTVGLATVVVLVLLLVEREAVRAHGGERFERWIGGIDIAVIPLLAAFGVVMVLRLLELLPG